jgi:hypothetical protein
MNRMIIRGIQATMIAGALMVLGTGCSTTSSTNAHALKPKIGAGIDLSKYQSATVMPFEPAAGKKIDASVGAKFADGVATRLQSDFGPLFREIRKGQALTNSDEVIVTGTIKAYQPGSRFGRAMLIGVGAASFKGDLILKDGTDNHVIYSAPFDKLWAWGGMLGMSKGIEDMVAESEAAVAATIAQAKGWRPSPEATKSK